MPIILQVIICSLIGGLFSLIGGILLTFHKKANKIASYATPFAAGALLAAAFIDLLPEAIETTSDHSLVLVFTLLGLTAFFLLETFIQWFHCHAHQKTSHHKNENLKPVVPLLILGDTLHNAIDGAAIAGAFLISPASGIIITIAIAAHEIPQEIGDFAVMIHHGISRRRTIIINLLSALAATISAVLFYLLGNQLSQFLPILLGFVAGFFIYIAATDIIPTIHQDPIRRSRNIKSLWLLIGVVVVSLTIYSLHQISHQEEAVPNYQNTTQASS